MELNDLELSVRLRNCLKLAGVETVLQLMEMTDQQILAMPNAGRKTLAEVREVREWLRGPGEEQRVEMVLDTLVALEAQMEHLRQAGYFLVLGKANKCLIAKLC